MRRHKDCNFSYAGLKTQVRLAIESRYLYGCTLILFSCLLPSPFSLALLPIESRYLYECTLILFVFFALSFFISILDAFCSCCTGVPPVR
jgi:hypothetical protein